MISLSSILILEDNAWQQTLVNKPNEEFIYSKLRDYIPGHYKEIIEHLRKEHIIN